MKRVGWQTTLVSSLILLSAVLYLIHFAIFRDLYHIFYYLISDIAFLPLEVLLVTLILHRLLSEREKKARLEKLNMVIGTFFSEVGTLFLAYLSDADPKLDSIRRDLIVTNNWSHQEFAQVSRRLKSYDYGVQVQAVSLEDLRSFLLGKRDFLVRLLENPSLLEHESFTELLRAVFHLTEELTSREDLKDLPETDTAHLTGDIKRAYILLVHQWLDYMRHLKDNYPYLFSLAMRTNPFDQSASPIVR
jgi:hypothetical protein